MKKVSTLLFSLVILMIGTASLQAQQSFRNPLNGKFDNVATQQASANTTISQRSPQVTFFEEGFESGDFNTNGWVLTDGDGDGNQWIVSNSFTPHSGSYTAGSNSWLSTAGPLTPDNWLATKAIDLSSAAGTVLLDFWVRAQDQVWPNEHYGVFASTSGSTPADFTGANGANLYEETVVISNDAQNNLYVKRTVDLSAYAGGTVYIAFRHFDCSDWFVLDLDDIIVYESNTSDVGITGVVAPSNVENCTLSSEEPVTVTIFNYGGAAQTGFDVSYSLNGESVTETFTETIAPASSANFTFAQNAQFGALGYFQMDFNVSLDGDIDPSNNDFTYNISNTDAEIVIDVTTDSNGGQAWELLSSTGEVIATHSSYQWNITETTKVCVIGDDCYRFNWYGGASNQVAVYYNGELINDNTATGDYTLYSVGGSCLPVNAIFMYHNIQDYAVVGDASFGGTFLNTGSEDLTSFDVQYTVNGVASNVETITGVNTPQGQTYDFVHPTPYNFASIGEYNIDIAITNLNGSFTPEDNVLSTVVNVLSYKPTTRILGEEATGTWCGWCTRGHVYMELMEVTYPDTWVGIAVHNADPMVISNYDQGIGTFIAGYPSGLVNRYNFGGAYDVDPSLFEVAYGLLINRVVPAEITIQNVEFDAGSREVQYTVNANFAGDVAKAFNMNAIILENDVTGTSTGYDQVNYYSGGASGPMGGYEDLGNPVPASQMVYQNVARALIGGWNGMSGIISNPTSDGTDYSYTFNYTVPAGEDTDNLILVGYVSDATTGEIINVNKVSLKTAVTVKEIKSLVDFNVYPNPSSDQFNIELNFDGKQQVSIYVTDNMGRLVNTLEENTTVDYYSNKLDMSAYGTGVYFLNVRSATGINVMKMVKL